MLAAMLLFLVLLFSVLWFNISHKKLITVAILLNVMTVILLSFSTITFSDWLFFALYTTILIFIHF
jgi:hypothetical protein